MGEVTSLEEIRRKRNKGRYIKRVINIAVFCGIIITLVVSWDKIKDTNLKIKWDNFMAEMGSGPGYPLEFSGGEVIDITDISDNPVVLSDSHLYIYNAKAKTMVNEQHGFTRPFVVREKDQMLLGDRGGNKLKIISTSGISYEHKTDNPLIDADINPTGLFGVVTESENFQGELSVFSKSPVSGYSQIFKWSSAENIISDLSISHDGSTLIAAGVNSENGILTSYVYLFNLADGAEIYRGTYNGEMIFETDFKGDSAVFISDKVVRSIDKRGASIKEYSFKNSIYGYSLGSDENIALILGDYRHSRSLQLVSLDIDMSVIGETTVNDEILWIEADNKGLYIVGKDKSIFYNVALTKTEEYPCDMIKKCVVIGNKLYYSTPTYIGMDTVKRPDNKKP